MFFISKLFLSFILFITQLVTNCGSIDAEEYLRKYGYLETTVRTEDSFKEALKTFQEFHRIPVTGVLDAQTKWVMSRPRCGNKDPISEWKKGAKSRVWKGYELNGSKWTNYKLTYKIIKYSDKLDANKTLKEIKESFKHWSAVTPLRFIYVTDRKRPVHFKISFARSYHCCHKYSIPEDSKFDGKGGTLAHAAYPQNGGDLHYDDDEDFDPNNRSKDGANFRYVTVHEIGHALGLEHILDLNSIMFSHEFGRPFTKLDQGTIDGVRALYGDESIILP